MCLAVPAQIQSIDGDQAIADVGGNRTEVNVALVSGAKVGDWVLVHAGFAITLLDEHEARQTFALLKELGDVGGEPSPQDDLKPTNEDLRTEP